jgi:fructose-1-phosphate kinase PfkB-like protein
MEHPTCGTQHIFHYRAPIIEKVVDCTGAGDTMFGTIAWANVIEGLPLELAVVVGIVSARMTLMSTEAVATELTNDSMKSLIEVLRKETIRSKL